MKDLLDRIDAMTPGQREAYEVSESYLTLRCSCGEKALQLTRRLDVRRCFAFGCRRCRVRTAWFPLSIKGAVASARAMREGRLLKVGEGVPR